jgi:hypothetical protein
VHAEDQIFNTTAPRRGSIEATTVDTIPLTTTQRQLIVALAEDVLTNRLPGRGRVPSSADAATRLGWPISTFNRKLDNVCDKLDKIGVPGLKGGRGNLATNRRARLVEYAVATRLVSKDDLVLLDALHGESSPSTPRLISGESEAVQTTSGERGEVVS